MRTSKEERIQELEWIVYNQNKCIHDVRCELRALAKAAGYVFRYVPKVGVHVVAERKETPCE